MPVCAPMAALAVATVLALVVTERLLMVETSLMPASELDKVEMAPPTLPQAEMSALSVVTCAFRLVIGACKRASTVLISLET